MSIVIDASAALCVVLGTPGSDSFSTRLDKAGLVMAPDLFVAEICNAVWKYRKADLLPADKCERMLELALSLPDRFESTLDLHREAYALAVRHNQPVYDALYLVLARRNGATVLTADRRLAELARKIEVEAVIST